MESGKRRVATRQFDDFVIVKKPATDGVLSRRTGAFALTGPGLDPDGIPFVTMEQAIERGTIIARNSRVSLWDATANETAQIVMTFRR